MNTFELNNLLKEVEKELPQEDVENIKDYITHNEWGLAYETLCTQLYEYNIRISPNFYEKMVLFGSSIKIDPSYWLPLNKLFL